MTYVWDTNIFIKAVRNPDFLANLNAQYDCFNPSNELLISAVTVGELYAFAQRNRWGSRRMANVAELLNFAIPVPVTDDRVIVQMYADIDTYSQSCHPTLRLPTSARKMGSPPPRARQVVGRRVRRARVRLNRYSSGGSGTTASPRRIIPPETMSARRPPR